MRQDTSSLIHEPGGEVSADVDPLTEEALVRRRKELFEIEQRAKAAAEKAQRHHEAEQRLAAEIKRHVAFLARIGSAEGEAPEQIEAAEKLMVALSDAMIALHGFEHAPIPQAARRWAMAQQMSGQMADAITAFLAPRVEETQPSPDQRTSLGELPQKIAEVQPATARQANGTEP